LSCLGLAHEILEIAGAGGVGEGRKGGLGRRGAIGMIDNAGKE
jgi:hypothetical protein